MKNKTTLELIAYVAGFLVVGGAITALKAWLLVLVLGWFGIHALGFWQAAVVVALLGLLFGGAD